MSAKEMKQLRDWAGLTQAQMAERMGLAKSAYVDIEGDDPEWKKFKPRHQLALERVSLRMAIEFGNIGFALPTVRNDALELATMIRGQPPALLVDWQEIHSAGTAFLSVRGEDALPSVGSRVTVTVDHHAAFRKRGAVVQGTVKQVQDRGATATVILGDLDPPLRPDSLLR